MVVVEGSSKTKTEEPIAATAAAIEKTMTAATKTTTTTKAIMNYLHIFPPVEGCYNMSPFGIKLESFFRVNKIPYEPVYTMKFGSKGIIPYITRPSAPSTTNAQGNDNEKTEDEKEKEEEICDSNVIINKLRQEYDSTDNTLTAYERAITHSIIRMLEEHTSQIGFHYRYGRNMKVYFDALDLGNRLLNLDRYNNNDNDDTVREEKEKVEKRKYAFLNYQPNYTLEKSKYRGLSRHSDEELYSMSNDDIQAIEDLLAHHGEGEEETLFFFAKPHATTIDCTVFGHLSQFLYSPMDFPQKQFLKDHCPNILKFMEHFKRTYWPDWEEKCQRKEIQS